MHVPARSPTPPAYDAVIAAPFGALGLRVAGECLAGIDFLPPGCRLCAPRTELTGEVARQLAAYFAAPGFRFDLPLRLDGTPYRQRVWSAIRAIPSGTTRTYGDLAVTLASAPRAVGQAVGDNPVPIVVPCHRVVGRHGLGGFAHARHGYSVDIKAWLLRHEGVLRG